jgi:hypothetical protein
LGFGLDSFLGLTVGLGIDSALGIVVIVGASVSKSGAFYLDVFCDTLPLHKH